MERQANFRPLAGYLIRRIVALALLCMVVVLVVQVWSLMKRHEARFEQLVQDIGHTNVPLLAVGLWDIEPVAVQRQVQAIADRPEIGHVRLRATTGQVFEAGDVEVAERDVVHEMAVMAPQGGMALGLLELTGDPGFLLAEVRDTAWRTLLGYGGFTLLVCGLVAWLLRRQLQQPLETMARYAYHLTADRLMQPLPRLRSARRHVDEIDLLADGFAKLQTGLRDHIAGLDDVVAERTAELERLVSEVHQLSRTDALTGCLNRRAIDERLPAEVERAQRYDRPLAVVFADVDHFKQINDSLGHAAGDEVLRRLAAICRAALRNEVDWVARFGGEEFLIVLPETGLEAAVAIAERLRQAVAHEPVDAGGGAVVPLTASFGATQYRGGETVEDLLARADEHLYQAKTQGRDRVVSG